MSRLNGRIAKLEEKAAPPVEQRIERRAGLVYLFWGDLLVKVIREDLWEAI